MLEYHPESYYVLLLTLNVSITLVVMLAACLCCKRKEPKNELLGLEGMVKLKNPDEVLVVAAVGNSESQADLNLSTVSNADSEKRASTAAHRSLPDIPVAESNADNGSELYETVADKHLTDSLLNRDKSPAPSLKQQASVSQHSSISQADDISSPYSRVKNSPHDYAKVRATEHPYAQLNTTSSASAASNSQLALNSNANNNNDVHFHRSSNNNLNESLPVEIPAASAIAGIIAASQDLPYMTPPIATQHFSGDSQDSSKGYTSISVREPLANILAQQPIKADHRKPQLSRDVSDSHYATVSDDSDETYAAIEDPNVRHHAASSTAAIDIYTSGSETYAQIQPMPSNSIIVSVEINNAGPSPTAAQAASSNSSLSFEPSTSNIHNTLALNNNHMKSVSEQAPALPPVDSLRAQMHSRQASSSSNTSSMGNLGSPKPEKRQANSPLPPTPKSIDPQQQQFLSSSNSNLTSGRNSVISVIECSVMGALDSSSGSANAAPLDESPQRKSLSPSKDIEGMYAKVMKKNKFSRNASSSQNNSPIMTRKYNDQDASTSIGASSLDSAAAELREAQQILALNSDRNRMRSNSYTVKDHGYETIPADAARGNVEVALGNRKSDCYANILQKERQMEGASELSNLKLTHSKPPISTNELVFRLDKDYATIAGPSDIQKPLNTRNSDPGYETLLKTKPGEQGNLDNEKKSSDYDPNYEELKMPKYNASIISTAALSDDGYAKVIEKHPINIDEDSLDGYSKVKGAEMEDSATGGYSTIGEVLKPSENSESNHNYASILETKVNNDTDSDHYARIAETTEKPGMLPLNSIATPALANNLDAKTTQQPPELPVTPSSLTPSSSLIANSSTPSSSNMTSTTTSTLSSRQTPSSQYESLTGSDTDPNYESVCYSNASSRENPYERLHTDYSDTQLSTPLTPEERSSSGHVRSSSDIQPATQSISNGSKPPSTSSTDLSETLMVDDYFQV